MKTLLAPPASDTTNEDEEEKKRKLQDLRQRLGDADTVDDLFKIAESESSKQEIQRSEVFEEVGAQAAMETIEQEAEHFLTKYHSMLGSNPRAMKRFINLFVLKELTQRLETTEEPAEDKGLRGPLARWTLLEMQYPLLAEHLREQPKDVELFSSAGGKARKLDDINESLRPLFSDKQVVDIVVDKGGGESLTDSHIRGFTGQAEITSQNSKKEAEEIPPP